MRKATVFADFYERVNYVSMTLCFGRIVSCVERLDTNGFKFSAQPSVPHIEFTGYTTSTACIQLRQLKQRFRCGTTWG